MSTDDIMALDLECRLTIAHRIACECAPYFARRRTVLLPEILRQAVRRGADPVYLFAEYARGVHRRHLAGLSLSTGTAA